MSIVAPATNPASDLELKLPATVGTAGQFLKNSSTAGTLEFSGAGNILQVVTDTSTTQINETDDFPQASGISVSITPAATSNNDRIGLYGIRDEGNTIIAQFRFGASSNDEAGQNIFGSNTIHRMYSPNTTSPKTYTLVYGRYSSTYNNTVSLNGGGGGDNRTTLTAIEVGS